MFRYEKYSYICLHFFLVLYYYVVFVKFTASIIFLGIIENCIPLAIIIVPKIIYAYNKIFFWCSLFQFLHYISRLDLDKWINAPPEESSDEDVGNSSFFVSPGEEHRYVHLLTYKPLSMDGK